MRQVLLLAVLGLGCLATAPARAATQWWGSLGGNFTHVNDAAVANCGGLQGAFTVGSRLMLRAQFSQITWEAHDTHDGNECDGVWWGDAGLEESALLLGVMSRSGVYIAAGPARAHFYERKQNAFYPNDPYGVDTGTRFELGWSQRRRTGKLVGVEVFAFQTTNDIRNYAGIGVNFTLGSRRPRISARPRPAQ